MIDRQSLGDPGLLLAKAARRVFARNPTYARKLFIRDRLRHWCTAREFPVTVPFGFRFYASPREYTTHRIFFYGDYDLLMTNAIRHLVREGDRAWDVGTERGWFTLLMATLVGKTGHIDSFEAYPPNADKLRANLALNPIDWVSVNSVAVSDAAGEAFFQPPVGVGLHLEGVSKQNTGVGHVTPQDAPGAIRVPTTTLDEYAQSRGIDRLDFIKMDIEGAETRALRGAKRVLTELRPVLAIEYNELTARRLGTSVAELDDLLESCGYDRFAYDGRFVRLDLKAYEPLDQATFNVYCFPRRRRPT